MLISFRLVRDSVYPTVYPTLVDALFTQVRVRGILGSPYTGSCILVRPRDRSRARSPPLAHHRYMRLATRLDRFAPPRIVGSRGSSRRFEPSRTSLSVAQARIT